jgi:uncharacterized OB-fold protein
LEDDDDDNFSANGFYQRLSKGKLSIPRCKSCNSYVVPPTSVCRKCLSTHLEWTNLSQTGKIISFSEIFVSNKKFRGITPYVVSIIETEERVRIPGIIKDVKASQLKIGDVVSITVDPKTFADGPFYYFSLPK